MSSKFLTNRDKTTSLSERVKALTKSSTSLDFLVGYFFFSGFCEIYHDIQDKPLRILIGMDAEVDLNNCIVEYSVIDINKKRDDSKQTVRNKYFEKLRKCINQADVFDSAEFEKSYRLFMDKLENGTLEIRKTIEPNHAKMYLFNIPSSATASGLDESKLIVGSSNFSIQGFAARNEINVYLQDEHDFTDGKKIFETLWSEAKPLVNKENKEELKNVLIHTWLETVPTPYQMYIRVLYEYFKISSDYIKTPKELTHDGQNQFMDVSYQLDAIRDGVAKVKKHSGCIVADVVGLGKSVIASAIAANLDKRTIIISPPHLKTQWEEYAVDFGLRGHKIYTSGKLEEAVNENKNCTDLVIIIDEAHRYRNENTEAYGYLHQLCAGNQVILLSATPFNNKPEDIFSMIKLFQIPAHSTIQTVNNLSNQMAELVTEYKKLKKENRSQTMSDDEFKKGANDIADKIRDILNPVVIRRTRIDLENLKKYQDDLKSQGIQFSDVKPPQSQTYELGDLSDLYIETLDKLSGAIGKSTQRFTGARYSPLAYIKSDETLNKKYAKYFDDVGNFITGQKNMADFMKQLLVRRFESSKQSFVKTLENIHHSMEQMKKWYENFKKIPMAKKYRLPDIEDLFFDESYLTESLFDLDTMLEMQFDSNKVWFIDADDLNSAFIKDLQSDIDLVEDFISEWKKTNDDPKLKSIVDKIKQSVKNDPKRKIIIFTEFSDTADYLYEELCKANIRVMCYTSDKATKQNRELLRANFDAGYPQEKQFNDYDVLVATDAISEGYSLHRAGTIYNYDIPYNPTRVIQRVGRINRINKRVFDELYIYNFFPTATGEEISHTAEISTFKMKLFQAILGADTKILTEDETLDGYFGAKFTEAENDENTMSWDVPFRNELNRIESEEKEILQHAKDLPQRCRIARQNEYIKGNKKNTLPSLDSSSPDDLFADLSDKGVLLFSKKGDAYRFCWSGQNAQTFIVSPTQALTMFKAEKDELPLNVSERFYAMYEDAKRASGIARNSKVKSKTVQDAVGIITFIKKKTISDDDKNYLDNVSTVISLDSLPTFYLKILTKINPNDSDVIQQIKAFLPENYIETLLEKDGKVGSEPETILLAEEIL